jgi:cytochrome P450
MTPCTPEKEGSRMTIALEDQSIVDPALIRCPYPFYAQLHAEAPVHRDPGTGMWLVAGYRDMQAVIKDTATFSNDMVFVDRRPTPVPAEAVRIFAEEGYARPQCLQRNDPPHHGRFRRLVDRAFTAGRVRAMAPYIDEVVRTLVTALAAGQPIDFVREFAVPLPCTVIADQLGVPRSDIPLLKTWSDALLDPVGMMITPEREIECARQVVEFQHYFAARIAERRAEPRDDILTSLVAAMDGEAALTTEEVLNLMEQLLTGGNETTTNAIGAGLLLLIDHPDQQAKLRADRSLIGNFVEEVLRTETPVQGLFRQTTCDAPLGDVVIPKGAVVMLRHGAVNRDPAKFPDPDRFDITRDNAGAQLAFGAGAHFCPGAMLARAELATAFDQLLDRFSSFELVGDRDEIAYLPSFFLRGVRRLDVILHA